MKKINQIATINDVSLNDKLKEWNEENEAFRVQLRIAYSADDSKDEEDDDLLSLADFEEAGASVGKTYTCLINFDSLLTDKHTEKEQDKALAKLVEKFKGKKARFSTFDFTISELTDGKEKAINDGTHTYSSLANTYLGSVEDEESEFNKLKNRMLDMVDNDFDFGQADEDQWGWGLAKQSPSPFLEQSYVTAQISCFNIQLLCTIFKREIVENTVNYIDCGHMTRAISQLITINN